jgi:hypothetical protein
MEGWAAALRTAPSAAVYGVFEVDRGMMVINLVNWVILNSKGKEMTMNCDKPKLLKLAPVLLLYDGTPIVSEDMVVILKK